MDIKPEPIFAAEALQDGSDAASVEQETLKREWGFLPLLGFATVQLNTWEVFLVLVANSLLNGGPVATVYGFIVATIGVTIITASLAEMASIAPTAGAQYYFSSRFAPARYRPFLGYLQGWVTVAGWQAAICVPPFLCASQVLALISYNISSYTVERWQIALLMLALVAIGCAFSTIGKPLLPKVQLFAGIGHITFFFILLVTVLAYDQPKASSQFVWATFTNAGGWKNDGISFCIGFLGPALSLAGADAVIHMSEETYRASVQVPRAMILAVVINGTLGFALIILLLYSIQDLDTVLSSVCPPAELLRQATGSKVAATALYSLVLILIACCGICCLMSASRLTWAFARDKGLPASNFISHVNKKYSAPVRAILVNFLVAFCLCFIVIGSIVAFNAITSLATIAIYASYMIPCIIFLHHRLTNPVKYGPFRLGKFGPLLNVVSIGFCMLFVLFVPFPPFLPVTGSSMNYAGPVFLLVLVFAIAMWFIRARKQFTGPRVEVVVEGDVEVVKHV